MVRLHLVGFTTDLKNLIFADERGATTGGYVVSLDDRLKRTLDEVARLEDAEGSELQEEEVLVDEAEEAEDEAPAPPPRTPRVVSKLSPKEIQSLLREGKTEEQVARLAGTEVEWVRRFSSAILAERRDVIDAVRGATLSKPRLGPSGMTVGEAVEENLGARRLRMGPEAIGAAWKAMRKNGRWQVSFEYQSRGQKRLARYSFDPNTRQVEPLNDIALELGRRGEARGKAPAVPPPSGPPKIVTGVRPTTGRSGATKAGQSKPAASSRAAGQAKSAASSRPAGGRAGRGERPAGAGGRAGGKAATPARRTPAARSKEDAAQSEQAPGSRRRIVVPPPEEPEQMVSPPPEDLSSDDTSDEFIIQRPRNPERTSPERSTYGTLPTVWRPSRRG